MHKHLHGQLTKATNTAKLLNGITAQGTLISEGWGGRANDQFITENSNFLK